MHRRLITIAILAAAVASVSATSAGASRSCGSINRGGEPVPRTVEILSGPLSCAAARAVAESYVSGRGTFHGPPNGPRSNQYITLPGRWRCSVVEQGGAACRRGSDEVAFVVD